MLSDDDFSEEECEDFRRKVIDGLLRKPTVREFEEKAKSLHVDITKHWIARELVTLQNLIDRANEKGWRRELFAYIERRDLLQTPSEQSRLLQEVPEVIADIVDFKSDTVGSPETDKLTHETLPNLKTPEKACCNMGGNGTFCSGIGRGDSTGSSQQPLISSPKGQHVYVRQKRQNQNSPDKLKSVFPNAIAQGDSSRGLSPEKVPPESHHGLLQHEYAPEDEQKKLPEPSTTEKISIANPEEDSKDQSSTHEAPGTLIQREGVQRPAAEEGRKPEAEVIDLSEDEGDGKFPSDTAQTNAAPEDVESYTWHCVSPRGERKGPFSLSVLKRWYGFSAYASKFKVWKVGQGPEQAVLLTEAIGKISPRCGGRDGICSES